MPWQETCAMDERMRLVADLLQKTAPVTTLCAGYGISRQTAYKWQRRYARQGLVGLQELSRRPHTTPRALSAVDRETILAARRVPTPIGARANCAPTCSAGRRRSDGQPPARSAISWGATVSFWRAGAGGRRPARSAP